MENSAKENLTSILDYLHLALRYIASGFVAIGVYYYLYNPELSDFKDMSWILVFSAAMIGILIYGLHFATLDKIFYGWSIMYFLQKNNNYLPSILKTQIQDWENAKHRKSLVINDILRNIEEDGSKIKKSNNAIKRYILFGMANQAYLRSMSKNKSVAGIQREVEKRLALLNFLYCSFYQILFLALYFAISEIHIHTNIYSPYLFKVIVLVVFSGLIFFCAIRFNRRICSREMWLISNFPQRVEDVK